MVAGRRGQWYEAHNSPGATTTGTQWALAEGEVGGTRSVETYILLANTSSAPGRRQGDAAVRGRHQRGAEFDIARTQPVQRGGRAAEFPAALNKRFGAIVESLGDTPAQIVVERAMYWDAPGALGRRHQRARDEAAVGTAATMSPCRPASRGRATADGGSRRRR